MYKTPFRRSPTTYIIIHMDLLEQYKTEHPEAFRQVPAYAPSVEHGFFIRLVIRLAGGKIRSARTAQYVLGATAGIALLVATTWWVLGGNASIDTGRNFIPAVTPSEQP